MSETDQPQEQPPQDQPQEQPQEEQPQEGQEEQPQEQTDQESFDQEQKNAEPVQDESAGEPYQPGHQPLQAAGLDQHAVEEQRQAELSEERQEHNDRTGDSSR